MEYIASPDIASIFPAIAGAVGIIVLIYLLYRLIKPMINYFEMVYNRETKWFIIEDVKLNEYAKTKGIDLRKEMLRRDYLDRKKKSFRDKMEKEFFESVFPKENKKK